MGSTSICLSLLVIHELQRRLDDVRVEGSGKTLVAGDHNDQHALLFAPLEPRMDQFARFGS